MLARHSLVWLSKKGWNEALACLSEERRQDALPWPRHDWPAVVRRPDALAVPARETPIALGLSVAPDGNAGSMRKRIALVASANDVARSGAPLPLSEVLASAPVCWRNGLESLTAAGDKAGITLGVFGSLAWQHLTGMPHMTPRSDIDLLFYPASSAQLAKGLELLSARAEQLPLDGEIVFPNGDAVAWKEWRQAHASSAGSRVLVKHLHGARLTPAATLLAQLS